MGPLSSAGSESQHPGSSAHRTLATGSLMGLGLGQEGPHWPSWVARLLAADLRTSPPHPREHPNNQSVRPSAPCLGGTLTVVLSEGLGASGTSSWSRGDVVSPWPWGRGGASLYLAARSPSCTQQSTRDGAVPGSGVGGCRGVSGTPRQEDAATRTGGPSYLPGREG